MTKIDKDEIISSLKSEVDALKTILAMMPGHIYWRNTEGFYLGCNTNIANMMNYASPAEVVGRRAIEFMPPELATRVDEVDLEVIRSRQERILEEQGFDKEGKPTIFLTRKSPLYDSKGKIQGILGISFDITERKENEALLKKAKEKAEAANRAKSQFLAMISHELRTPLTSILGFANFLNQDELPIETRLEYTGHILNSGAYLLTLINSLLDYNKLENNKFELYNSPVNLNTVFESVISMLGSSAKLKNLKFNLKYDTSIPDSLMADSKIFQQILINLAGNAIKFTEKGHVTIHAKCVKKDDKGARISISVEDTGIGIPVHEQQAIFKRFYQLENVYTRNESLMGTGLGLSIVKKLASLLESKVEVASRPNRGSTFSFKVNLTIPTEADLLKIVQEQQYIAPQVKSKFSINPYVLLVEDDQLIQIIHRHMLEDLGCKVDVTGTAKGALEKIKNDYDLFFIDIGLPDMAGIDLIKTIRKKHKKYAHTPIIVLTGYSDEKEVVRCLRAGAKEVAVKPVSEELLEGILERAVRDDLEKI